MPSMAQASTTTSSTTAELNAAPSNDTAVTTKKRTQQRGKENGKSMMDGGAAATATSTATPVEQEEKEDASLLAVGTKNELPLQFSWGLWYSAPKNAQAETAHKWDTKRAKQIVEFGSVEEFWRVFNNLTPPSKLAVGSDLQLFRAGVQPAWEDTFNAKGGSWTIKVPKEDSNKLDTIWFNTVLTMIGDNFDDADDICGITVSSRAKFNRFQLWTRYADDPSVSTRIGEQLKEVNRLTREKIQFLSHDDAKDYSKTSKGSEILL